MPIFHDSFEQPATNHVVDEDVFDCSEPQEESTDQGIGEPWEEQTQQLEWRPSLVEGVKTSPVLDRGELIERIKRGESPSWLPGRNVSWLSFLPN